MVGHRRMVRGSKRCIEAILDDPRLEAVPVELEHGLTVDSDTLNRLTVAEKAAWMCDRRRNHEADLRDPSRHVPHIVRTTTTTTVKYAGMPMIICRHWCVRK